MNIFYGAAFDPPTKAHIEIIRRLVKNPDDHVCIGITDHDYKNFKFNYNQRSDMLDLAMKCQGVSSANISIVRQNHRTWRFLAYQVTNIDAIAIGEDEWQSLMKGEWEFSRLLLEKYLLIVIPRKNGISSTKVREWIMNGTPYNEQIAQYIDEPVYMMACNF